MTIQKNWLELAYIRVLGYIKQYIKTHVQWKPLFHSWVYPDAEKTRRYPIPTGIKKQIHPVLHQVKNQTKIGHHSHEVIVFNPFIWRLRNTSVRNVMIPTVTSLIPTEASIIFKTLRCCLSLYEMRKITQYLSNFLLFENNLCMYSTSWCSWREQVYRRCGIRMYLHHYPHQWS